MLAYEFHPLAEKELDEAVAYYEALELGKGRELLQRIQAAIEQARQFPKSAPISRGSVRSLVIQPAQRWSYTLHYRATPSVIRILAVAHQKRQPFYWLQRQ
jgi:plasmid stabilization system protein ParE